MGRLTIRTEKGAALKLNNPQNEIEAGKQLHDKYLIAIEKLAHYEDMEEQGRLIELPCAVGDKVWMVVDNKEFKERVKGYYPPAEELLDFHISEHDFSWLHLPSMMKRVFLTKEEAEAKLKELEGDKK